MAKPKEKASLVNMPIIHGGERSVAFENRAKQELDKLTAKVARALSDDLICLFETGEHTDLVISNERNCEIKAHKCVLQARARHLWQDSWISPDKDADGNNRWKLTLSGLSEKEISAFARQVYTVSNSALLIEEFLPFFPKLSNAYEGDRQAGEGETSEDPAVTVNYLENKETNRIVSTKENGHPSEEKSHKDVKMNTNSYTPINSSLVDNILFSSHVCKPEEVMAEPDVKPVNTGQGIKVMEGTESVPGFEPPFGGGEKHSTEADTLCQSNKVDSCGMSVSERDLTVEKIGDERHGNEDKSKLENGELSRQGNGQVCEGNVTLVCPGLTVTSNETLVKSEETHTEAEKKGTKTSCDEPCGSLVESSSKKETIFGNGVPDQKLPNCSVDSECVQNNFLDDKSGENSENSTSLKIQSDKLSDAIKSSYSLSVPYDTCSAVGEDLLRMYLQQMNCDLCLSVDGVKFLTHKCVLASRSTYFQAMLGGRWSESEMEEIHLQGVSAQALEKLLLFLYGGVVELCTPSDLVELFVITDMYGVETMKSALKFYVRKDLCHFFHKPCNKCVSSASHALNLCDSFHLEELEERCLKWCVKYFTKIWSTKTFAGLPETVHQKCSQCMLESMTEKSVLDTIMECSKLSSSLPRIKWTESILYLTTHLMDSAIEYTSSNFISVIRAPEFLQWGKVAAWKAGALEEIFNSVIDSLPIDTACSAYQTLVDINTQVCAASVEMPDAGNQDILDLLDSMVKRCEKFLKTHIHQVARSRQWASVGKSLQTQILENSSYIHFDQFPDPKPKPVRRPVYVNSAVKLTSPSGSRSSHPASKSYHSRRGSKSVTSSTGPNPHKLQTPATAAINRSTSSPKPQVSARLIGQSPSQSKPKSFSSTSSTSSATNESTATDPDKKNKSDLASQNFTQVGFKIKSKETTEGKQLSTSPSRTHLRNAEAALRRSASPGSRLPVKIPADRKKTQDKPVREESQLNDQRELHENGEVTLDETRLEGSIGSESRETVTCSSTPSAGGVEVVFSKACFSHEETLPTRFEDYVVDEARNTENGCVADPKENLQPCVAAFNACEPHGGENAVQEKLPPIWRAKDHLEVEVEGASGLVDTISSCGDDIQAHDDTENVDCVVTDKTKFVERDKTLNQKTEFWRTKSPTQIRFIVPED